MLKLEEIGRVAFDPLRQRVLFEKVEPWAQVEAFGFFFESSRAFRTTIYAADLRTGASAAPLFTHAADRGYRLGALSPDRRSILIWSHGVADVTLSVLDLGSGEHTELPVAADWRLSDAIKTAVWETDETLLVHVVGEDQLPWSLIHAPRRAAAANIGPWETAWRGNEATADRIGTGAYAEPETAGGLVRVNIRTGAVERLVEGSVVRTLTLSPDRRYAVIYRELYDGAERFDPEARPLSLSLYGTRRQFVLVDLTGQAPERVLCDECPVRFLRAIVKWAPGGDRLLFRRTDARGRDPDPHLETVYYLYDLAARTTERLGAERYYSEGLGNPVTVEDADWLADQLLVKLRPSGDGSAARWHVDDLDGSFTPLSSALPDAGEHLATHGPAGYFLADGDVWRIAVDGTAENLTLAYPPLEPVDFGATADTLWFQTTEAKSKRVIGIPIFGGEHKVLIAPAPSSQATAISHDGEFSAFRISNGYQETLIAQRGNSDRRTLLTINTHLFNVAAADYIAVEYETAGGEDMISWFLPPPGYTVEDGPLPTIVRIYPGHVWSKDGAPASPAEYGFLNPHIASGKGYGVLWVSVPLEPIIDGASDPMLGLSAKVDPALDRAVEMGLADPDRLGLIGHSFGGQGVLSLAGQSDRYKAIVAHSPITNLISHYGSILPTYRFTHKNPIRARSWITENSQGRMGSPPWRDLDRYVRNSPLFQVPSINTPIMLIHGDLDSAVSIAQSEEMYMALARENKDAVFVRYWGEGHDINSPANIRDMWKRITAWYDEHLYVERDEAGRMIH